MRPVFAQAAVAFRVNHADMRFVGAASRKRHHSLCWFRDLAWMPGQCDLLRRIASNNVGDNEDFAIGGAFHQLPAGMSVVMKG